MALPSDQTSVLAKAWDRVVRAGRGVWWAMPLCVGVSILGFANVPSDFRDSARADSLQAQGEWARVARVEVNVVYAQYRQGREGIVEAVRVRVDGSDGPVPLENLYSTRDEPMLSDGGADGWRQATPETGYQAPLMVRIRRDSDGNVTGAMAKEDYTYWTVDNSDPEIGLTLGLTGVASAVALFAANRVRLRLSRKRPSP
ncbi:hypothetical protein LL946_06720 [Knoellia locipacati]|uniref:hypothetical protein n=1 Tax=Knoellia locipacati TaxID=882824 RepID=UPI0038516A8C